MIGRIFTMTAVNLLLAAPAQAAAPDFETEVLPVLTKSGCNTGACHGAAIGRGGFRLSLLGYDPDLDYESIVHEFQGRRINQSKPERSLLLRKPTQQLAHEGGHKLGSRGAGHQLLMDWIAAGAPRQATRKLVGLHVTPATQPLTTVGDKFSIAVQARFDDRSEIDVTAWSVFTPTDSAALHVSGAGRVTAKRRGQSAVMVRFLGEVGCVTVTVPFADAPPDEGKRPRSNFIDDHVNRSLDQLRLPHSPRASDEMLVRRLYLDLIGTLPEPKEVADVLADKEPERIERLVDRLLKRPEFAAHWAAKWGDLLRIDSNKLQPQGARAFHDWLRGQLERNTPLDRLARDLLLSLGDGHQLGPVNFSRVPGDAGSHAEYVSEVFLGVRLQCANCHNHPLDRWTQDDYHGLAAIFAKLGRGQSIALRDKGEVVHPRTGQAARPRLPGGAFLPEAGDQRARFADWLTAADNPHFARNAVNRLWRELLGRGLVEPIDDQRATNPPTHPELLDALARDFVAQRFDLKHAIKTIVSSAAYCRTTQATGINKEDESFYSRSVARPLPAAVLVDAVARVTGVPEPLGGQRAIELVDARVPSQALDLLGRCDRVGSCTPGRAGGGALPLALHKINGAWLNAKIAAKEGRLHQLIAAGRDNADIVGTLYQAALGRQPTERELDAWKGRLTAADDQERIDKLEDFFWALLNAPEFTCNR